MAHQAGQGGRFSPRRCSRCVAWSADPDIVVQGGRVPGGQVEQTAVDQHPPVQLELVGLQRQHGLAAGHELPVQATQHAERLGAHLHAGTRLGPELTHPLACDAPFATAQRQLLDARCLSLQYHLQLAVAVVHALQQVAHTNAAGAEVACQQRCAKAPAQGGGAVHLALDAPSGRGPARPHAEVGHTPLHAA